MKIIKKLPFFWPVVKMRFPSVDPAHVVFSFGDDVYSLVENIEPAVMYHESIHAVQQGRSKVIGVFWWMLYLTSRRFRMKEELAAYKAQLRWVLQHDSRNREYWYQKIVGDFSSPNYGWRMTRNEALKKLLE